MFSSLRNSALVGILSGSFSVWKKWELKLVTLLLRNWLCHGFAVLFYHYDFGDVVCNFSSLMRSIGFEMDSSLTLTDPSL
jgi:hypothetical protein